MNRRTQGFDKLFSRNGVAYKPVIGMVHLKALPGAPAYGGDVQAVIDAALADATALEQGGADGIMVENFFDAPFFKDHVGPETVAAMTRVMTLLRGHTRLPLGVNVLRNDGMSALAIATACDCQFVRINQLAWAMLTDQGILEGKAAEIRALSPCARFARARLYRLLDQACGLARAAGDGMGRAGYVGTRGGGRAGCERDGNRLRHQHRGCGRRAQGRARPRRYLSAAASRRRTSRPLCRLWMGCWWGRRSSATEKWRIR